MGVPGFFDDDSLEDSSAPPSGGLYGVDMTDDLRPHVVTSVLVEEAGDSVTVTWGLGEEIAVVDLEYFGYEVYYYGPGGTGGKRFGVRFQSKTTAYVWDNASGTQANYEGDCVSGSPGSVVVHYRDADLGPEPVDTITAFAHVNGIDVQQEIPVTLLR